MEFYKSRNFDRKKPAKDFRRDDKPYRSFRNSRDNNRESATVTCADCGTECEVPFVPKTDRPVYCSECFRQNKPQDSRDDRYSRNDRNSRSRDDRYSRNDRNSRSRDNNRESATVTCADCGTECEVPFVPKTDRPVYCSECFRQNKPQDSRDDRYSRNDRNSRSRDDRYSRNDRNSRSRDNNRESATVTCADCGTECEVPFVPKTDRPVYCSECFRQNKPQDSRDDRYSRNDRNSRSRDNNRESNKSSFRSNRSKNDRFLKKQESFYSNGSDKFYASLKEKLFEILGGKICSSCGFKDERALGINHISDDVHADDIGRGGPASSWGKYISEPDLARKDLKVLCLNCNEIRQPLSTSKENNPDSRSKRKKSKYFPR